MEYFIVLFWFSTIIDEQKTVEPVPRPKIEIYSSAMAACNSTAVGRNRDARIYRLSIKHKDCKATPDAEFINCLVADGDFTLKEGSCKPKQEFVFDTETK